MSKITERENKKYEHLSQKNVLEAKPTLTILEKYNEDVMYGIIWCTTAAGHVHAQI